MLSRSFCFAYKVHSVATIAVFLASSILAIVASVLYSYAYTDNKSFYKK